MFDTEKDLWSLTERAAAPNRRGAGGTADIPVTNSDPNKASGVPLAIDQIETAADLLLERERPWPR